MGDYPDGYVEAHLPDYPDEPLELGEPDSLDGTFVKEIAGLRAELAALRALLRQALSFSRHESRGRPAGSTEIRWQRRAEAALTEGDE